MTKQPTTAGTSTATGGQRGRRPLTALGTAALVVVLATLGMTGTAAAAPTGGNAPSAKACQKDGYTSLARAESPTVAFTSSDECTAYAAEGGTLTPLQTVNLDAFREACEAINGDYMRFITGASVEHFCVGYVTVQSATFEAACDEMNGTSFAFYESYDEGVLEFFDAICWV